MLFKYTNLDKYDASEDCLVAKMLLGLIFNEYVPANRDWQLAREFIRCYLDADVESLNFAKAEILVKPKFSWFSKDDSHFDDRTAPDILLYFPGETLIAVEAKYTLPIQAPNPTHLPHQLLREFRSLSELQRLLDVEKKYLFLLMTHQRLFAHLNGGRENVGVKILRQCLEQCGDDFRINTWNCVYHVIMGTEDGQLPGKTDILSFLTQKQNYMTNSMNGKKSGQVSLLTSQNGEIPAYGWEEIKRLLIIN